jgi:hypothetical protein
MEDYMLRRLTLAAGLTLTAALGGAATFNVTSTADSGAGSLRKAIDDANTNPGADTIQFNIVGSGVQTITPATSLPPITDAVTIDGYTQSGASANTKPVPQGLDTVIRIEISGVTAAGMGLDVRAPNVTIRGLAINRFSQYQIDGNPSFNHSNLKIEGCFLGPSPDGTFGYYTPGGATEISDPNLTLGGSTPAARNLISMWTNATAIIISGDASGSVKGNLVGTDMTGTRRMPGLVSQGTAFSILNSGALVIGGPLTSDANVVAGFGHSINLGSGTTTIQGNFIGVDANQSAQIYSGEAGIYVTAPGSVIGGSTTAGDGNVIGGHDYGIILDAPVATLEGNFIGTDKTATRNLGNRALGILVSTGGQTIGGIQPGKGNVIAYNGAVGVLVEGLAQNPIRGNRMFKNGFGGVHSGQAMGIDLHFSATPGGPSPNDEGDADPGANERQNYPIITSAVPEGGGTRVIGTLNSLASTTFDLDFYSNSVCLDRPRDLPQAEFYLGSTQITTDASGNASFNLVLVTPIPAGAAVTATATDPNGNTSELTPGIVFSVGPGVGGPGDTGNQTIAGQLFDAATTVTVGGNPVAATFFNENTLRFIGPSLTPGGVYDVTVTNPGGLTGTIQNGYVSRFLDVPKSSLFDLAISKLVASSITAGIGNGNFGPGNLVTRQQMAVFVLKAKHGACYVPPACTQVFNDVPCGTTFAPWVNQFAAEGITGGCGNGNYCPLSPVRRDQMAVFLLKGRYGSNFTPPECSDRFDDVVCPSTFADWIEFLAGEGITSGCGGNNYCPLNNNTRGQMAAFLVNTFTLP